MSSHFDDFLTFSIAILQDGHDPWMYNEIRWKPPFCIEVDKFIEAKKHAMT